MLYSIHTASMSMLHNVCVFVCACQVLKVFIDNPFPIALMKQQSPIRCLDLSARSLITDSCIHYVI